MNVALKLEIPGFVQELILTGAHEYKLKLPKPYIVSPESYCHFSQILPEFLQGDVQHFVGQ